MKFYEEVEKEEIEMLFEYLDYFKEQGKDTTKLQDRINKIVIVKGE